MYDACIYQDLGVLADYESYEDHPQKTYGILNALNMPAQVSTVCFYHHEAYDGSGYPKGIRGEDIPYNARLLILINGIYERIKSRMPLAEMKNSLRYDPEMVEQIFKHKHVVTQLKDLEKEFI